MRARVLKIRRAKSDRPRQQCPRLAGGICRENCSGGLPPPVKDAIRAMAEEANKTMNYIREEIILEWFRKRGFSTVLPEYVQRERAVEEVRRRAGRRR